ARQPEAPRPNSPHRRPPRTRGNVTYDHRVDGGRVPLDGDAGSRQHQPVPLHDALLSRTLPLAWATDLRRRGRWLAAARPALGLRDDPERSSLALQARGRPARGSELGGRRSSRAMGVRARARRAATAIPDLEPRGAERRRRGARAAGAVG